MQVRSANALALLLAVGMASAVACSPSAALPTTSSTAAAASTGTAEADVAPSTSQQPTARPAPTARLLATAPRPTSRPAPTVREALPVLGYRVVNVYPHDPTAFTEGLVYEGGVLYESTGLYGQSSLRKVALETGEVLQQRQLPQFFGEGLALCDDRLVQLTWKDRVGFVYDRDSFELLRTFSYSSEGWGLAFDGKRLIMSDGTAILRFLDPATLEESAHVVAHDALGPVAPLNELEYVEGEILANVWKTQRLARIDPATGRLTAWIDLSGLEELMNADRPVDVLNGIAYDNVGNRLFVTGKWWPCLFEIELVAGEAGGAPLKSNLWT